MSIIHLPNDSILETRAQTVVCPVNTTGVMGKGLALAIAKQYRGILYRYRIACVTGALTIDTLWVYSVNDHRQVLCLPTKLHWRNPSKIEWIDSNLQRLAEDYQELNITSLAMPKIGCGLGGLDWIPDVRPLVYKHLEHLDIPVYVYGE